jgi:hypothetical protein
LITERQRTLGYRFIDSTPEDLARVLNSKIKRWAEVAETAALVALQ